MRLRLPAALATTLALLAMLGGCFLLPVGDPRPSPTASATEAKAEPADPEVGDCWTTDDYNWGIWESWRGDAAVDCEEDHESYTYAVLDLLGDFDEIYRSNGFAIAEPAQLAFDSCYAELDELMGSPLGDYSRMISKSYLPSKSEWKEGARWVRCDLLVYEVGSSLWEQVFAELPDDESTLIDARDDDADYFDFCLDTDEGFTGFGPYFSDTAVYSYCSWDPMWRLIGSDTMPGEYNADYPGDDAIEQYAMNGCFAGTDPQLWGYAHYPDYNSWFTGDRAITCWAYEWEVPEDAVAPI